MSFSQKPGKFLALSEWSIMIKIDLAIIGITIIIIIIAIISGGLCGLLFGTFSMLVLFHLSTCSLRLFKLFFQFAPSVCSLSACSFSLFSLFSLFLSVALSVCSPILNLNTSIRSHLRNSGGSAGFSWNANIWLSRLDIIIRFRRSCWKSLFRKVSLAVRTFSIPMSRATLYANLWNAMKNPMKTQWKFMKTYEKPQRETRWTIPKKLREKFGGKFESGPAKTTKAD